MRSSWRKRRRRQDADLNITAFMNLMVVLTPFLLITAVFSRMAILELNLPGDGSASETRAQDLQLEVIVRAESIEVGDRSSGLLTSLPRGARGHDFAGLSDYLQRVKGRYPDKTEATLLLEADVPYDVLVQVMDTVRVVPVNEAGRVVQTELFPDIAVGDAPLRAQGG
jgi:biopolymer transport protein ExbD